MLASRIARSKCLSSLQHCRSSSEWTSNRVRKQFVDYFTERGHEFVKPIPMLNADRNPLLVNAGMNQFKSIFLNDEQALDRNPRLRELTRAVNYQKCVRLSGKHNDLEEVGKDYTHHTFFEMLGNWSFNNQYFKEDACRYALDLLTNHFGIDRKRLVVTYFGGDQSLGLMEDIETKEIWLNLGFPEYRVISMKGTSENFWDMAELGPCGVCTELHYVNGDGMKQLKQIESNDAASSAEELHRDQLKLLENCVEIWNLVFIQYERTENGLKDLSNRHVDTGMGLERILAILNEKQSNFDTDLFAPLIRTLEDGLLVPPKPYGHSLTDPLDIGYRIVVDHVRAICMLISDDVMPAHTNEGLLIRRLIRRSSDILRHDFHDKIPKRIFKLLIQQVVAILGDAYPELRANEEKIVASVFEEIKQQVKSTNATRKFLLELKKTSQTMIVDGESALKLRKRGALSKDELNRVAGQHGLTVDWAAHDQLVSEEIRKSNEVKERKRIEKSLNR